MKQCLLLVTVTPIALMGCGGSDLPELGKVSGVVTLDGKPLENVLVRFTPVSPGRPSSGPTGPDGRYELRYTLDNKGAVVGRHTVHVEHVLTDEMKDAPDPADLAPGQVMPNPPVELPPAASDGSITREVKTGSNKIDIEL